MAALTVSELIEALQRIPDNMRGRVVVYDTDEVELTVHRVLSLASGLVILDAHVGSIGIGDGQAILSEDDINTIRDLRLKMSGAIDADDPSVNGTQSAE